MWDVFISYASADRDFVEPLVKELQRRGVKVWHDEAAVALGASLLGEIDRGLAESRFGIPIVSERYFARKWTKRELAGFAARESSASMGILPIWHGIEADNVARYSPFLADFKGISSSDGIERVAGEIERVVRGRPAAAPRRMIPQQSPRLSSNEEATVGARERWWKTIWEQTIPLPAVAFMQFAIAMFLLNIYNPLWALKFGASIPLWSSLPSLVIGRIFRGRRFLASGFGMLMGLAIGGGLMFAIIEDKSWIGAFIGAALVSLLSGFWAEPRREIRVVVAILWTALLAGSVGAFNLDYYNYLGGLDLFVTGSALVWWGIIFIGTYYLLGLFGVRESVLRWIYQEDEERQSGGPGQRGNKNPGRAKRKARR